MLNLKPAFVILAVTNEGVAPAKYYKSGSPPLFDTEALAREEILGIAGRYASRGTVPPFIVAPCLTVSKEE